MSQPYQNLAQKYMWILTIWKANLVTKLLWVKITNNKIKDKRQKIESEISQLIDLFKLPEYQQTVLPSVGKRKSSPNLFKDNKLRYSQMVNLGHKLIKCVIKSLRPGPSRELLERDVVKKISRGYEVLGTNSVPTRMKRGMKKCPMHYVYVPKWVRTIL